MKFPCPALLLLLAGLAALGGCGRKKRDAQSAPPAFTPAAIEQVTEAEKSPQASLDLLNELLQNWVLRHSKFPQDPQEFVTSGMLPRLPAAPPGKRFLIDARHRRVVLADR